MFPSSNFKAAIFQMQDEVQTQINAPRYAIRSNIRALFTFTFFDTRPHVQLGQNWFARNDSPHSTFSRHYNMKWYKEGIRTSIFIEKQNTTSNLWNYIDNNFSFDNTTINVHVHKIIGENVTALRLLQIGLTATSLWPTLSQIHNMCGCLQTQLQCVLLHGMEQSLHTSFMVTHASEAYVHTHTRRVYRYADTHNC